jgi:hypothetical protein
MMTKDKAIKYIQDIQHGNFNRNEVDVPKGQIAERIWNDSKFSYGMEYGAILALMKAFNITKNDLYNDYLEKDK